MPLASLSVFCLAFVSPKVSEIALDVGIVLAVIATVALQVHGEKYFTETSTRQQVDANVDVDIDNNSDIGMLRIN